MAVLASLALLAARPGDAAPLTAAALPVAQIPVAVDQPYPGGAMSLDIDASDTTQGVFKVTQTIPVAPGTDRLTLLFPEWLPGNHAPRGPVAELIDLRFFSGSTPLKWRRDPIDVHAFHIDLPPGARSVVARFVHTSPLMADEGRVTVTREMLNLQWEKMSLYPAGHFVRQIRVRPAVTLPQGWNAATALDGVTRSGNRFTWAETDYERLVDSPIFAGAHFRRWDLGNNVSLDAFADDPALLQLRDEPQGRLSALVSEALATFGPAPYEDYTFLVALSDRLGRIGLEHLESSENQLEPRNFVDWGNYHWDRNVLPHELAHAWNGKYRRPVGLWTPDYRTPMRDELLWVYEGQTQFWGWVLGARSGVVDKAMVLGMIAQTAGHQSENPGRSWRSVGDTTLDPIVAARKPRPFASLARTEDYYHEGALIWLEADQLIRRSTGGRKGLDDFARDFFAYSGGGQRVKPYGFEDVVASLNRTYEYDWARFLNERIDETGRPAPLAGIEEAGYKLVWKRSPNPYTQARMNQSASLNLYHSLGANVENDGDVVSVRWDGPAFRAGLASGSQIVAVNDLAYTPGRLGDAITAAPEKREPVRLLVRRGARYGTISVPYYGGLRWPWLERAGGRSTAALDELLSPRR